jgi:hypothetical protein
VWSLVFEGGAIEFVWQLRFSCFLALLLQRQGKPHQQLHLLQQLMLEPFSKDLPSKPIPNFTLSLLITILFYIQFYNCKNIYSSDE